MYDVCASVKNIILAGDFNAVTKAKDRIGSKVQKLKKYETYWNNFIKNINLVECNYDKVLSAEDKMTWSNGVVSSKIDKIFYFKDLTGKFLYSSIKETCKSDHKAVFANFKLNRETINGKKYLLPHYVWTYFNRNNQTFTKFRNILKEYFLKLRIGF
jgi:hypothetical protein